MENHKYTLRYGVYSFLGIASFFLLMKLFGWEEVAELRVFNLLIIIYMTNRLASRNYRETRDMNYVERLISLVGANAIALALSIVGFAVYATFLDPGFMEQFHMGILWSGHMTLSRAIGSLLMEGLAGSLIVSFITMQYWKDMRQPEKEMHTDPLTHRHE